jgi:hypothetical protein
MDGAESEKRAKPKKYRQQQDLNLRGGTPLHYSVIRVQRLRPLGHVVIWLIRKAFRLH